MGEGYKLRRLVTSRKVLQLKKIMPCQPNLWKSARFVLGALTGRGGLQQTFAESMITKSAIGQGTTLPHQSYADEHIDQHFGLSHAKFMHSEVPCTPTCKRP